MGRRRKLPHEIDASLLRRMQRACWAIMRIEIECGRLPKAGTLSCVDCGRPAFGYDHRDYREPLEVEAVCRRHNRLRGRAAPFEYMPTCIPSDSGSIKNKASPRGYDLKTYTAAEMAQRIAASYEKKRKQLKIELEGK